MNLKAYVSAATIVFAMLITFSSLGDQKTPAGNQCHEGDGILFCSDCSQNSVEGCCCCIGQNPTGPDYKKCYGCDVGAVCPVSYGGKSPEAKKLSLPPSKTEPQKEPSTGETPSPATPEAPKASEAPQPAETSPVKEITVTASDFVIVGESPDELYLQLLDITDKDIVRLYKAAKQDRSNMAVTALYYMISRNDYNSLEKLQELKNTMPIFVKWNVVPTTATANTPDFLNKQLTKGAMLFKINSMDFSGGVGNN